MNSDSAHFNAFLIEKAERVHTAALSDCCVIKVKLTRQVSHQRAQQETHYLLALQVFVKLQDRVTNLERSAEAKI